MIRRRKKKPRPAGPGLSALTSAEGDLGVVLKWKLRGFAERGPLAWRDPIGEVRLAGSPAVRRAAVRTLCLGHSVRKRPEAVFFDVNAGGKVLTRGRALQHQHAHGYLSCLPGSEIELPNPARVCSATVSIPAKSIRQILSYVILHVCARWPLRGRSRIEAPHWVPLDRRWGTFGHGNHYGLRIGTPATGPMRETSHEMFRMRQRNAPYLGGTPS
jgi:hypothetical protein